MIVRHAIEQDTLEFIEDYVSHKHETLGRIHKKNLSLYLLESLYKIYLELSSYELYLTNDESKCLDYLNKSMQCCEALYRLALNVGKPVEIKLDNFEPVTLTGQVNYNFILPWSFDEHVQPMFILRKNDAIRTMLQIDDRLFAPEKAGLSAPNFNITFSKVFKSFLKQDQTELQLIQAIEQSQREVIEYYEDEGESWEDIGIIFIHRFLQAILLKDQGLLKRLVEKRLLDHKDYSNQDILTKSEGIYSFFVTGLVAFAHDIGMEIDVESDYLPQFLVQGIFTKERIKWPMV